MNTWTAADIANIITLLTTFVTAITLLVNAWFTNRKMNANRDALVVVKDQIEVVHKATNSMKDDLVALTRSDATQKGHTQGVADQKAKEEEKC